uniref:Secreted protein n=1 Tax=Peronospora matthiolae TaxID=2874970 RepID=A0AAV1UMN5_9STRA
MLLRKHTLILSLVGPACPTGSGRYSASASPLPTRTSELLKYIDVTSSYVFVIMCNRLHNTERSSSRHRMKAWVAADKER